MLDTQCNLWCHALLPHYLITSLPHYLIASFLIVTSRLVSW